MGVSQRIKLKVSELLEIVSLNEPFITQDLIEISEETSVKLVGLENRFKTETSLFRKLSDRLPNQDVTALGFEEALNDFAGNINDVLRYTIIYEFEEYVSCSIEILNILKNKGYKINKIWNAWLTAKTRLDFGYRGINITMTSQQNQIFELQFHTFESYTAKEANHFLYEQMRLSTTSNSDKKSLRQRQIENVANLKFPPNVQEIR